MVTQHIFVTGKVQGVNYRRFAAKEASDRQLTGWVRNLSDGRVEVLVQGPRERVIGFIEELKKGPIFAHVQTVENELVENHENMTEFSIAESSEEPWKKK